MGKKDPKKGGVYSDCWHIPGGGIDEGKDKVEALIREVKEETNISITKDQIYLVDDQGRGVAGKVLDNGEKVWCNMIFNVYKAEINKNSDEIKS
jgi:8-oxo-dGTP pyrophosphatase MutT (NUDIX family)